MLALRRRHYCLQCCPINAVSGQSCNVLSEREKAWPINCPEATRSLHDRTELVMLALRNPQVPATQFDALSPTWTSGAPVPADRADFSNAVLAGAKSWTPRGYFRYPRYRSAPRGVREGWCGNSFSVPTQEADRKPARRIVYFAAASASLSFARPPRSMSSIA